jgi:formate-dependent nitrite reductase membrane component NrfD
MPDYVNESGLAYDWMIAAYFFLGGLGAGAFLFSVGATYWKKELQPLAKAPAVLAPLALGAGMLLLLLHLGQPMRFVGVLTTFNPSAALSWGAWFLNIFGFLSVIYAFRLLRGGPEKAKAFGYLGLPFAILAAGYTGVLLNQAPGKPLWNSSLLPVLFVNGALISGAAVAMLLSIGKEQALLSKVSGLLSRLILLELALVLLELVLLFIHSGQTAEALVAGRFAILFLGVEIVLGGIVPLVLLLASKKPAARVVASALVLIGVFAMRFIVVVGGQIIE